MMFIPFFLQPPTKRINYTTIKNDDGDSVLVVGLILNEGASGPSPTELEFAVDIPKTGFYNFILRFMVRVFSSLLTRLIEKQCYVYKYF